MTRKRRSRITVGKKSAKNPNPVTPGGLNQVQFDALPKEYGCFEVEDEDSEPLVFRKGYLAFVQYSEDPEEAATEKWIGQIIEIRGTGPTDVWVKLCWYWAPHEVTEVIKSFTADLCGQKEKLFTDNHDFLSPNCFIGHAKVKFFDETSLNQPPIGRDEWFQRYGFMYRAKRVSSKLTCILCGVPYSPDVDEVLHFCPRKGCCVAYHQACLLEHGYIEPEEPEQRKRRLLESWPAHGRTESVESLAGVHPPRKRRRQGKDKECISDPLAGFPTQLVAAAQQQIVRGTHAGGIVGNVRAVCAARTLIHDTLSSGDPVPDDWETRVYVSEAFPEVSYPLPYCFCPTCHSPI